MLGSAAEVIAAMLYLNRLLWPVGLGAIIAMAMKICERIAFERVSTAWRGGRGFQAIFLWTPVAVAGAYGLWLFADACVGRPVGRPVGPSSFGDALTSIPIAACAVALALNGCRLRTERYAVGQTAAGPAPRDLGQARGILNALGVVLVSMGLLICNVILFSIVPGREWKGDVIGAVAGLLFCGALLSSLAVVISRIRRASFGPSDAATRRGDAVLFFMLAPLVTMVPFAAEMSRAILGFVSFENGASVGYFWAGAVLLLLGARSTLLACERLAGPGRDRRRARIAIMLTAFFAGVAFVQARGLGFISAFLELSGVGQWWLMPIKAWSEGIVFVPAFLAIGGLLLGTVQLRKRIEPTARDSAGLATAS
jgi:hypothetical protein